jgi:hypothetical protein
VADHTRRRPFAVAVAGATAGMTAVLAFGHVADAFAATLPGSAAVVGVGGKDNPTSDRIQNKFQRNYLPYGGEFVGAADNQFYGVNYPATLPIDESVTQGRQPLIDTVAEARTASGPEGTIYLVSYSEGTILAEKYKRELDAGTVPSPGGNIEFVYIAAPTVPNGGIYARFPNLGPLSLLGFTSTGASAPTSYDQTFLTIEYDPVGDFPAYANPLSLANAAAGFFYLHGDPTPDAADLNDPDAVIVKSIAKPGGGTDTYILVKTEHLPLLQPIRDVSTALNTTALTEPVLGAIEPTLKLGVDMGYTDRDYSDPATPTRFSLITPPKRIIDTVNGLPGAIQEGADNFKGGLPSTTPPSVTSPSATPATTERIAAKPEAPKKPVKRTPTQRRDDVRNSMSDVAKNVRDSSKPKPKSGSKSEPKSGPKHQAKPQRTADTDKAA